MLSIRFCSVRRLGGLRAGALWVLVLAATGCGGGRPRSPGAPVGATVGRRIDAVERRAPQDGEKIHGVIDRYMTEQAVKFSGVENVIVERSGDDICITLQTAALFALDSAQLNLDARDRARRLAGIVAEYTDTDVTIAGHTDSEGPEDFNQRLSERRAQSVRNYFVDMGIEPGRIHAIGFGELRPVAGNDTEAGRRRNQRVEIHIRPNGALRKRAAAAGGSL